MQLEVSVLYESNMLSAAGIFENKKTRTCAVWGGRNKRTLSYTEYENMRKTNILIWKPDSHRTLGRIYSNLKEMRTFY
jgi:hypothetical protein